MGFLFELIGLKWIITIIGVVYILSPIDLLPELVLGPVGFTDDALVLLAIVGAWYGQFVYDWASLGIANAVIAVVGVVAGLIVLTKLLGGLFSFRKMPKGSGKWGVSDVEFAKYYNNRSLIPTDARSFSSFVKLNWR